MNVISRVIKNQFQKSYLEVEGVPFLYNAVQSWFPPEGDYEEYIKHAAEAGYKVFTFWLYWSRIEPVEGQADFGIMDRLFQLADLYNMKLDIVWAGTDFCDHLDPRFAPEWVLSCHDWHLKNEDGSCFAADGYDMGSCCAFDPRNTALFEKEKRILRQLFAYIKQKDQGRTVIMIQVENEINIQGYHGYKEQILEYIDKMAKEIKDIYPIAARANIVTKDMDEEIDRLQYIDAQGLDTYDSRLSVTRRAMLDARNSKLKYIAENAAYENSSAHIITALVHGGYYNIYKIDHDTVWDKPGVYGRDWSVMPHTVRIKNINTALNQEPQIVAVSPKEMMMDFNCELDGGPQKSYQAEKYLAKHNIAFKTEDGSAAMVVAYEDTFYCFADGKGVFKIDEGEEVEYIIGACMKIKS